MAMSQAEQIKAQVEGAFSAPQTGEFRPFAMFDESLDCIRVVTRDCSVTETRISDLITVLEDNYPASPRQRFVGFTIKGARHFCRQEGLDIRIPVKVTDILDRILKTSPEAIVRLAIDGVARPMVEDKSINDVSFSSPIAV